MTRRPWPARRKTGPVLFISNHPYGVLDGITLTWLATKVRPDTKVLANDVLCQAPEAAANLLPVAFAPTREARETNVNSRIAGAGLAARRAMPSASFPAAASRPRRSR